MYFSKQTVIFLKESAKKMLGLPPKAVKYIYFILFISNNINYYYYRYPPRKKSSRKQEFEKKSWTMLSNTQIFITLQQLHAELQAFKATKRSWQHGIKKEAVTIETRVFAQCCCFSNCHAVHISFDCLTTIFSCAPLAISRNAPLHAAPGTFGSYDFTRRLLPKGAREVKWSIGKKRRSMQEGKRQAGDCVQKRVALRNMRRSRAAMEKRQRGGVMEGPESKFRNIPHAIGDCFGLFGNINMHEWFNSCYLCLSKKNICQLGKMHVSRLLADGCCRNGRFHWRTSVNSGRSPEALSMRQTKKRDYGLVVTQLDISPSEKGSTTWNTEDYGWSRCCYFWQGTVRSWHRGFRTRSCSC